MTTYTKMSEAMEAVNADEFRMTAGKWNTDNAGVLSRFDVPTRKFVDVATFLKRGDTITVYGMPHESALIERKNLFT